MPSIFRLLSWLSLKAQYRLAYLLSIPASLIPNRMLRYTRLNLSLCLPEIQPEEQKLLTKLSIRHSCYTLFEIAAVWCSPAQRILPTINSQNVCTSYIESHKGRVLIVPHLGCWELMGLWAVQQSDLMCLYKPQSNAAFDQFLFEARSRTGIEMLPTSTAGLRQMSRGLKQGKTVIVLPDQRPGKMGAEVMHEFFGHSASSSPLIYKLSRRTDSDFFIAAMFRNDKLNGFDLEIDPLQHDLLCSDQQQSLHYLNQQMENLIKKHPEQYQWGYRRFPAELYQQQLN